MPELREESGNRISSLHKELSSSPFTCDGSQLTLTCSLGVAWFHPEVTNLESLLNLADQALYSAKGKGRNCVEVAERITLG